MIAGTDRYRAVCSCGYTGRWFRDGNAATEALDNHQMKAWDSRGRMYDRSGHGHHGDVEMKEVQA